ncbi:hypothetical protein ACFLJF_005796, partial [Salmonella enterica]
GKGIDLHGTLAQAQLHGMSPLDALVGLSDRIIDHDPKIRALRKKLNSGNLSDSEAASTRDALQTMENDWLTKLLGDPYSVRAMTALRNQRQARADNLVLTQHQRDLPDGQGAAEVNFQTISGTSDFKTDQAKSLRELSQMDAMKPVADAAGKFADVVAEFNQKFPGLSQAAESASLAIQSMTAAAVTFAGLKLLFGNKIPGIPGMPKSPGTPEMPKGLKGLGLSTLLRAPLMLLEGYVYEKGAEDFPLVQFESGKEKRQRVEEKYGPTPDEIKNVVESPGLSDVFDEWRGWWHKLTDDKDDAIPPRAVPRPAAGQDIVQPNQVPGVTPGRSASDTAADISANSADRPLNIHTHFYLDGQELAEKMTEIHERDALRSTGGGF